MPVIGLPLFQRESKNKICFLILVMCGYFIFGCSPNERIFYKNNIACSASNRNSEDWLYHLVELGTPNSPYNGQPVIDVDIPGVVAFTSDSITREEIMNIAGARLLDLGPAKSTPKVGLWPEYAKEVYCGPYLSFVVDEEKILQVAIMHKGRFKMHGTEKWYELPCSEDEIIEVFGKPDRTFEWFRE